MRGQIERYLSPYEQKVFGDIFDTKLMMMKARRKLENIKDFLPGLLIYATTMYTGNYLHEKYARDQRY